MEISILAFDADDTLWHNETLYLQACVGLKELLANYQSPNQVEQTLGEVEVRNVYWYGYGIKSYTLSMIETAIRLTEGRISGLEIQRILELGKEMLGADVRLFELVEETLAELIKSHDLMLITKGDLLEQSTKLNRSGLKKYFKHVEIVQEKSARSYQQILDRQCINPGGFLMVGNSLKSDILPVLEIGGQAVYIQYLHTWTHENVADVELQDYSYYELEHLGQLPGLIVELDRM